MKVLKGLALSLLGFLLFLSLSIFSLAFMLNSTILNPNFITSELDRLDMSSLVEEFVSIQTPEGESPEEVMAALTDTITKLEPLVKEQLNDVIYYVYDYLLGKSQDLDLALVLGNTALSPDFIVSVVDEIDIYPLVAEPLIEQIGEVIPEEAEYLVDYLEDEEVIAEIEPLLKEQLIDVAADPILDYLLGQRKTFDIAISLEPVKTRLRDALLEAVLKSPPPELAGLPQAEIEQRFDELYQDFAGQLPATLELDESLIGEEIPAQIDEALAQAEEKLAQAKQYVGYFQLGYKILIGFMLLLILGIILISRQVKDITRRLGIPCLTYGALWYASIFAGKYFADKYLAGTWLPLSEIPPSLQTWLPQFIDDLMKPLEMLSLGLLIGGIVLIVVSFVYPRWRQSKL